LGSEKRSARIDSSRPLVVALRHSPVATNADCTVVLVTLVMFEPETSQSVADPFRWNSLYAHWPAGPVGVPYQVYKFAMTSLSTTGGVFELLFSAGIKAAGIASMAIQKITSPLLFARVAI
jgi:hypothetical protein